MHLITCVFSLLLDNECKVTIPLPSNRPLRVAQPTSVFTLTYPAPSTVTKWTVHACMAYFSGWKGTPVISLWILIHCLVQVSCYFLVRLLHRLSANDFRENDNCPILSSHRLLAMGCDCAWPMASVLSSCSTLEYLWSSSPFHGSLWRWNLVIPRLIWSNCFSSGPDIHRCQRFEEEPRRRPHLGTTFCSHSSRKSIVRYLPHCRGYNEWVMLCFLWNVAARCTPNG